MQQETVDAYDASTLDDAVDVSTPDLQRAVGPFDVVVWFTPDLSNPQRADVFVVDRANLIPVDGCTVDAVDAVDRFRHPAVWSSIVRDSIAVQS